MTKDEVHDAGLDSWEKSNYWSMVLLGTGVGKTKMFIRAIKKLKPKGKILILVNSTDLRDNEVFKEFHKWRAKTWLKKIKIVCYQTAYKWKDKEFGLVIGDEADFAINTKYWKFFENNKTDHLLLTTATLPEAKEEAVEDYVRVSYKYTTQNAQDDKILNQTNFMFVNYLLSDKVDIPFWYKDSNGAWQQGFTSENARYLKFNTDIANEYNKQNPNMETIKKLTLQRKHFLNTTKTSVGIALKLKSHILSDPKNRVIIFSEFSTQADAISDYAYHSNSPVDNLTRFNNKEINEIAVCQKVNRGINLVECNNAIYEGFSGSRVSTNQRVGRLTRLGVDDVATMYIMVPHYQTYKDGNKVIKRTCIYDYVERAFKDFDLSKAEVFKF